MLLAVLLLSCAQGASNCDGKDFYVTRIEGDSMLPTLQTNDVTVINRAYPYRKLRRGDIAIIRSDYGYNVIHRIIRRHRGGKWITRGDNNRREDYVILTADNYGGLALVGESSIARHNRFLVKRAEQNEKKHTQLVAENDIDRDRLVNARAEMDFVYTWALRDT